MTPIVLILLLLVAFFGLRELLRAASSVTAVPVRKPLIFLGILATAAIALRLGGVIGLLSTFAIGLARFAPALIAFFPLLRRILNNPAQAEPGEARRPASPNGNMSRLEAYQILGLSPGATREEVLTAHRRLMQKMHPDRGGSDYLAVKINQARETLLAH